MFPPCTTPNSRTLAEQSERTERLWSMSRTILATTSPENSCIHLRTDWSDRTDLTNGTWPKYACRKFWEHRSKHVMKLPNSTFHPLLWVEMIFVMTLTATNKLLIDSHTIALLYKAIKHSHHRNFCSFEYLDISFVSLKTVSTILTYRLPPSGTNVSSVSLWFHEEFSNLLDEVAVSPSEILSEILTSHWWSEWHLSKTVYRLDRVF